MKSVFGVLLVAVVNGCAVMTVSEDDVGPESADAVSFQATGRPTYDQVWIAAIKARGAGMTIVESHIPSRTIKSRVGSTPTGKVVAFFVAPTTPAAPAYRIETVSKKPMGLGQPERRSWEPSVSEDFKAALGGRYGLAPHPAASTRSRSTRLFLLARGLTEKSGPTRLRRFALPSLIVVDTAPAPLLPLNPCHASLL